MPVAEYLGQIACPPLLQQTFFGYQVCYFDLLVPGKTRLHRFRVVVWEEQALVCAQHLKPGSRVIVQGRLVFRRDSGQTALRVYIHEAEVTFLSRKYRQFGA